MASIGVLFTTLSLVSLLVTAHGFAARGGSDFDFYDSGEPSTQDAEQFAKHVMTPEVGGYMTSRYGKHFVVCVKQLSAQMNVKVAMGLCLNKLAQQRLSNKN